MNRSALKKYAPQARLDFIEAVTLRARRLGLDPELSISVEQTGDVLLIGGQPFPASVATQRSELARRIQQQGFDTVVEALAYTWFNRLVAIRFMELKGYLSHGYRVLSHPEGQQPEILEHAQHLDLPGLDKEEVIRLKTAGNQDEALYREILLAQCHELHRNMPFLFEALDDATELLLPDNLLRTDSLIARLVGDIEEADWQEVEVIGWLYQFYISDKKDEVIGKVVKSEDIPAATQLFTPNWIVQYLVQNSLGRLWLMANPGSSLKDKMPYYIEPAEQTPEVQAQLDALIKTRMDEDGGTLNPESLTVLDPACGSGHILVEAYNLLRAIYEERGYRLREIPRLILQKNLYGLDIDDRAAQLAGFALLMKAREDDRRLFDEEGNPPHLNVMAIQQSAGLPDEEMARVILNAAIQIEGGDAFQSGQLFGGGQLETQHSSGLTVSDLRHLIQLFEHGKTFGSLINVPDNLKVKLGRVVDLLATVKNKGDNLSRSYACQVLEQCAWPASVLATQYDAVIANPPYMGSKGMNWALKDFLKENFQGYEKDLYSAFIGQANCLAKKYGLLSFISMDSWMFGEDFTSTREKLRDSLGLFSVSHLGARAFDEISGEVVQTVAFSGMNSSLEKMRCIYFRLVDGKTSSEKKEVMLSGGEKYSAAWDDFNIFPRKAMVYYAGERVKDLFSGKKSLQKCCDIVTGLQTGDNEKYIRYWYEVDFGGVSFDAESCAQTVNIGGKWFPYVKGSEYKKWYGNNVFIINWKGDGVEIKANPSARPQNSDFYFKSGFAYNNISKSFCARYVDAGAIFDQKNSMIFPRDNCSWGNLIGFLNSKAIIPFLEVVAQKDYNPGSLRVIPYDADLVRSFDIDVNVKELIRIARLNWESFEIASEFQGHPMVRGGSGNILLAWDKHFESTCSDVQRTIRLEEENNKLFLDAYGFGNEVSANVAEEQVSLVRADREKDMQRLISYVIGCMMGRYSLDESGLIYAHSGGVGFDSSRYRKFPADADGIIPVTEESWFEDDAAERVREFVKVVWGAETLVENMEWLADSLGRKAGESADEAVRRYLSTSFYKDHLQTYKKRPIYWLFSSGKQKAFECLVYLHRYNEGTLSRMRMEYVVPLQSRMQARIDKLSDDIDSATSSAQQKALQKRKDKLTKQLEELRRFDEKLRPYADKRITLDLDDGVKANYGEFGDLLAEVKAITGGKDD